MYRISHKVYYLVLIFGLGLFSFLLLYFENSSLYQKLTVFLACFGYALWSMIQSHSEHRLTKHVALEYFYIALFAFSILMAAIYMK